MESDTVDRWEEGCMKMAKKYKGKKKNQYKEGDGLDVTWKVQRDSKKG